MSRRLIFSGNVPADTENRYIVGAGVGGKSRSVRRALLRRASNNADGVPCGSCEFDNDAAGVVTTNAGYSVGYSTYEVSWQLLPGPPGSTAGVEITYYPFFGILANNPPVTFTVLGAGEHERQLGHAPAKNEFKVDIKPFTMRYGKRFYGITEKLSIETEGLATMNNSANLLLWFQAMRGSPVWSYVDTNRYVSNGSKRQETPLWPRAVPPLNSEYQPQTGERADWQDFRKERQGKTEPTEEDPEGVAITGKYQIPWPLNAGAKPFIKKVQENPGKTWSPQYFFSEYMQYYLTYIKHMDTLSTNDGNGGVKQLAGLLLQDPSKPGNKYLRFASCLESVSDDGGPSASVHTNLNATFPWPGDTTNSNVPVLGLEKPMYAFDPYGCSGSGGFKDASGGQVLVVPKTKVGLGSIDKAFNNGLFPLLTFKPPWNNAAGTDTQTGQPYDRGTYDADAWDAAKIETFPPEGEANWTPGSPAEQVSVKLPIAIYFNLKFTRYTDNQKSEKKGEGKACFLMNEFGQIKEFGIVEGYDDNAPGKLGEFVEFSTTCTKAFVSVKAEAGHCDNPTTASPPCGSGGYILAECAPMKVLVTNLFGNDPFTMDLEMTAGGKIGYPGQTLDANWGKLAANGDLIGAGASWCCPGVNRFDPVGPKYGCTDTDDTPDDLYNTDNRGNYDITAALKRLANKRGSSVTAEDLLPWVIHDYIKPLWSPKRKWNVGAHRWDYQDVSGDGETNPLFMPDAEIGFIIDVGPNDGLWRYYGYQGDWQFNGNGFSNTAYAYAWLPPGGTGKEGEITLFDTSSPGMLPAAHDKPRSAYATLNESLRDPYFFRGPADMKFNVSAYQPAGYQEEGPPNTAKTLLQQGRVEQTCLGDTSEPGWENTYAPYMGLGSDARLPMESDWNPLVPDKYRKAVPAFAPGVTDDAYADAAPNAKHGVLDWPPVYPQPDPATGKYAAPYNSGASAGPADFGPDEEAKFPGSVNPCNNMYQAFKYISDINKCLVDPELCPWNTHKRIVTVSVADSEGGGDGFQTFQALCPNRNPQAPTQDAPGDQMMLAKPISPIQIMADKTQYNETATIGSTTDYKPPEANGDSDFDQPATNGFPVAGTGTDGDNRYGFTYLPKPEKNGNFKLPPAPVWFSDPNQPKPPANSGEWLRWTGLGKKEGGNNPSELLGLSQQDNDKVPWHDGRVVPYFVKEGADFEPWNKEKMVLVRRGRRARITNQDNISALWAYFFDYQTIPAELKMPLDSSKGSQTSASANANRNGKWGFTSSTSGPDSDNGCLTAYTANLTNQWRNLTDGSGTPIGNDTLGGPDPKNNPLFPLEYWPAGSPPNIGGKEMYNIPNGCVPVPAEGSSDGTLIDYSKYPGLANRTLYSADFHDFNMKEPIKGMDKPCPCEGSDCGPNQDCAAEGGGAMRRKFCSAYVGALVSNGYQKGKGGSAQWIWDNVFQWSNMSDNPAATSTGDVSGGSFTPAAIYRRKGNYPMFSIETQNDPPSSGSIFQEGVPCWAFPGLAGKWRINADSAKECLLCGPNGVSGDPTVPVTGGGKCNETAVNPDTPAIDGGELPGGWRAGGPVPDPKNPPTQEPTARWATPIFKQQTGKDGSGGSGDKFGAWGLTAFCEFLDIVAEEMKPAEIGDASSSQIAIYDTAYVPGMWLNDILAGHSGTGSFNPFNLPIIPNLADVQKQD